MSIFYLTFKHGDAFIDGVCAALGEYHGKAGSNSSAGSRKSALIFNDAFNNDGGDKAGETHRPHAQQIYI